MNSSNRSSSLLSRSLLARVLLLVLCLSVPQAWTFAQAAAPQVAPAPPATAPQQNILPFIKNAWNTLGRSMNDCSSISDPKFGAGATSVLYLPYGVTAPPAVAALSKCGVKVENLPKKITGLGTIPVDQLNAHGLLYLPNKYVVSRGPLQRDVRLGQLLHHRRPARRRRARLLARHHRELLLRDRELRRGAQRQSRLLPHALAAALPDLDDHGAIRG